MNGQAGLLEKLIFEKKKHVEGAEGASDKKYSREDL